MQILDFYRCICHQIILCFVIVVLPEVELFCGEVRLARILTLNCSSPSGPVQSASCSFDGGPPSSCELIRSIISNISYTLFSSICNYFFSLYSIIAWTHYFIWYIPTRILSLKLLPSRELYLWELGNLVLYELIIEIPHWFCSLTLNRQFGCTGDWSVFIQSWIPHSQYQLLCCWRTGIIHIQLHWTSQTKLVNQQQHS